MEQYIDICMNIFNKVIEWNWTDIIASVTGILTVIVAFSALYTWKDQLKADKRFKLLDDLTDNVNEFVELLNVPIQHIKYIKMHINSLEGHYGLNNDIGNPQVVYFIEQNGQEEGQRLIDSLSQCNESLKKIESLLIKGKVLDLKNYDECINACKSMINVYNAIQGFYVMISRDHLNWDNDVVQETLETVIVNTDHMLLEQTVQDNQKKYVDFVKERYADI